MKIYHSNKTLNITLFSIFVIFGSSLLPEKAIAAEGVRGWCTPTNGSFLDASETCYNNPQQACEHQWSIWGDDSKLENYTETKYWFIKDCHWNKCPALKIPGCSLILPGGITFRCEFGYERAYGNRCVKEPEPERQACTGNNGETPNPTAGNPIVIKTGSKIEVATDFESGDGLFKLSRFYRSFTSGSLKEFNNPNRAFGTNWYLNFAWELHIHRYFKSGYVTLIAPDGSGYNFSRQQDGTFKSIDEDQQQVKIKLSFNSEWPANLNDVLNQQTQWTITDEKNTDYIITTNPSIYDEKYRVGLPTEIIYSNGYQQFLTYGAYNELKEVSDSFNKKMVFHWVKQTENSEPPLLVVQEINLPDDNSILYGYDGIDDESTTPSGLVRLTSVKKINQLGETLTNVIYHYEDEEFPFALTGITDARGIRSKTWAYDDLGRAISSEDANGTNKTTITYEDGDGNTPRRIVTNALGKKTVYHYKKVWQNRQYTNQLVSIDGKPSANCVGSKRRFHYNEDGFVDYTVDEEGNYTRYKYDDPNINYPTRIIEADGVNNIRTTSYTWDTEKRLPKKIIEPNLQTTFLYDEKGRVRKKHQTDRTTHTEPYATQGQTRSWYYTYTDAGLLKSVDGPLVGTDDKLFYFYDANGYLERIKNELDHQIKIRQVNGRGQPEIIEDPNGVRTYMHYDTEGRLFRIKAKNGAEFDYWRFRYSKNGDLIIIKAPDGSFLRYYYDGNSRIYKVENNLKESIRYFRDAMGNIKQRIIKDSDQNIVYQQTQIFDELGRLMTQIGADNKSWIYKYDRLNRQVDVEDPRGHHFTVAYDGLNRIINTINEEEAVTTLQHDKQNNVITHSDARDVTTSYVRNGWGDIIREVSPDRGTIDYVRNKQGLMSQKTDAKGIITTYKHDAAKRILRIIYPADTSKNVTFHYDEPTSGLFAKGQLTSINDNTGKTRYFYDEQSRVTKQTQRIDSKTYTTKYSYKLGRLATITYPSGMLVKYAYNAIGKVIAVNVAKSGQEIALIDQIDWLPFGGIKQINFASGMTESRGYDKDYRLKTLTVRDGNTDLIDREYRYDDGINITAIDDHLNTAKYESFGYSPTNRINQAIGAFGQINVSYDLSGNRLSWDEQNISQNYITEPNSNQLNKITGNKPKSYIYDAAGNLTHQNTANQSIEYVYNIAGRLSSIKVNNVEISRYRYNHKNQLTVHYSGGISKRYLYDEQGHRIVESRGNGTILRETIWLGDKPLAIHVVPNNTFLSIHTDHLERPLMLTNQAKTPVWKVTWKPWGAIHNKSGNTKQYMRFPGQMALVESELFYNWNRFYDPITGRYITSDPIGLEGGANTYAYVGGNPVNFVDPEGLVCVTCKATNSGGAGYIDGVKQCNYICKTKDGRLSNIKGPGENLSEGDVCFGANYRNQYMPFTGEFTNVTDSLGDFDIDTESFWDKFNYPDELVSKINKAFPDN